MEGMVAQDLKHIYAGKKVFVTGHTGFKGAWLCMWLHQLGAIVKGYALESEYEKCIFSEIKSLGFLESEIYDIRDKQQLENSILSFQPDYIFHLAAQPLVRKSYSIPSETFEVNAIGTANLLEAVIKLPNKCAVIIITTDKVYENKERDILYNENDVLGGYDPYSASKACTEIVVSSFRSSFFNTNAIASHKKAIASVRAGNVIGGGDFSNDRIIPDIVKSLQQNKTIEVRNPNSVRPWQHVLEPLSGYLLLGGLLNHNPIKYSGSYNFGPNSEDHLTVKELVELSITKWGSGNWVQPANINQPHEAGLLKLDITKAKEVLGWQPKLNASKSIEWTIDWYKKASSEIADFTFEQINSFMAL